MLVSCGNDVNKENNNTTNKSSQTTNIENTSDTEKASDNNNALCETHRAYSFIMNGIPCNVIGSVIDKSQSPEMIAEMKATVEAMIKTVRSEQ